jgi:hypothetical protein
MSEREKTSNKIEHPKFGMFVGVGFDRNGREGIGRFYTMFDLYSGILYFNKAGKLIPAVSDDGKRALNHAEMIARPDYGEHKQVTMTIGGFMPLPVYDDSKMNIVYSGGKFARADSIYPSKVREMITAGKSPKEIYEWLYEHKAILGQEAYDARLAAEQAERERLEAETQAMIADKVGLGQQLDYYEIADEDEGIGGEGNSHGDGDSDAEKAVSSTTVNDVAPTPAATVSRSTSKKSG